MNIFFLSDDVKQCAEWMVNSHVCKQIVESAQMLCTAHRLLDGTKFEIMTTTKTGKSRKKKIWKLPDYREELFYKATHINHPSAVWARTSVENYNWLVDHLFALGDEYTYRYGKKHLTMTKLGYYIQSPPFNLKEWDWTDPPCAMDPEYKISDSFIENYRNYYRNGKKHLHNWKKRDKPYWIEDGRNTNNI